MKRIVLLEDSYLIRQRISQELKQAGFSVFSSYNPKQALKHLDRNPVDWLIVNPCLAQNSGFELLYELSSWSDLRQVKIILLTYDLRDFQAYKLSFKLLNIRQVISLRLIKFEDLIGALN